MFPGTYLENFIKIRSVTAEILLNWINVARILVAWTNVTMESVLDVPRNLQLKVGGGGGVHSHFHV